MKLKQTFMWTVQEKSKDKKTHGSWLWYFNKKEEKNPKLIKTTSHKQTNAHPGLDQFLMKVDKNDLLSLKNTYKYN